MGERSSGSHRAGLVSANLHCLCQFRSGGAVSDTLEVWSCPALRHCEKFAHVCPHRMPKLELPPRTTHVLLSALGHVSDNIGCSSVCGVQAIRYQAAAGVFANSIVLWRHGSSYLLAPSASGQNSIEPV